MALAGVREHECTAAFGVEARSALKGNQGNGRVGHGAGPGSSREVLAPLADHERLAGAVGHRSDRDRVVAEENPVAVVAARRSVVVVDDVGVQARRIAAAD